MTDLIIVEEALRTVLTALAEAQAAQAGVAQCCICGKKGLSTAEDGGPECELHDGRWVCSSECWEAASSLADPTGVKLLAELRAERDDAVELAEERLRGQYRLSNQLNDTARELNAANAALEAKVAGLVEALETVRNTDSFAAAQKAANAALATQEAGK